MRRLIFTDVHANEPAFRAILEDVGQFDEALFLGDIVGWGPHPRECTALLQEMGAVRVLGNHDHSCCADRNGWLWDQWTYDQLTDDMRAWILDCPFCVQIPSGKSELFCIHKAPASASYLRPSISPKEMADAFGCQDADLLLCGHCHHGIERVWNNKRYACIRAVGQMRDGDPQTGYTIEENGRLTHYRVPYDTEKVIYDLKTIGLESAFLERWSSFIRTAYDSEWSRL